MPQRIGIVIALAGAGLIALAGCKDEAASISSPDALLGRQHKVWNNAREALRADRPDALELIRSVQARLFASRRRVKMQYAAANKEEVLNKLKSISDGYEAEIAPKLTLGAPKVALVPPATMADVRAAFEKLDEEYKQLEAMAPGGK